MKLSLNEHFMILNAVFQRTAFIQRSYKRLFTSINTVVSIAKHLYNSGFLFNSYRHQIVGTFKFTTISIQNISV